MDNSPVMMEKPYDLTLEVQRKVQQYMELIMSNPGLFYIREQIFGYLNYDTVENCRKVSELWNQSLERIALVKLLQEFGDRGVEHVYLSWDPGLEPIQRIKCQTFFLDGKTQRRNMPSKQVLKLFKMSMTPLKNL